MADILKPDIYATKGRFYCLFNNTNSSHEPNAPYNEESEDEETNDYGDVDNEDFDVIEEKGCYKIEFQVPSDLLKFIIGKKGETINKLKKECNLRDIQLGDKNKSRARNNKTRDQNSFKLTRDAPNRNADKTEEDYSEEYVRITGTDKKLVIRAACRIQMIVHEKRNFVPYSHYVCIPLDTPEIQSKKETLKSQIAEHVSEEDRQKLIYIKFSHITLSMVTILNKRDLETVSKIVTDSLKKSNFQKKMSLDLEELEIMGNDDYTETNILYMKGKNLCWASDLAVEIQARFADAGIPAENRPLKPHMTLIHQQGDSEKAFDATDVFLKLGDVSFGSHEVGGLVLVNRSIRDMVKFDF
jgi:activating signal cointegrator complex subunit 1